MDIQLNSNLVLLDIDVKDKWELLEITAENFYKNGYVKDTYKDAVIAREKVFATGLPTLVGGVAIPHTDVIHVEKPGISLARITKEVDFVIMGDDSETVAVNLIFMLAMKEEHTQVTLLQNLMGILQDEDALKFLKSNTDKEAICEFINERLAVSND